MTKPFVHEEGCNLCCRMGCVVVGKFGKGEKVGPVILPIVDVYPKVLFEDLVAVRAT
jgi:hypothetical protein